MLQQQDLINLKNDIRSIDCCENKSIVKHGLHHSFSIRHKNHEKQKLWELLLTYAISAEKKCPWASKYFIDLAKDEKIEQLSTPKTKRELIHHLDVIGISSKVINVMKSILDHATVDTIMTLHTSSSDKMYVEMTSGHRFELKCLIAGTKSGNKVKNVRIACIDGFIENVSELHVLFSQLSESHLTCFVFCRGMSNDVLHTIKVNNDRGSLRIKPYLVPYDIENVNVLVDLAVISGTDVTSSLKGDLISTIDLTRTGHVDEVTEFESSIIMSTASSIRLNEHIERLRKERDDRSDISEVIDKRLKSLTASCARIYVPDDMNYFDIRRQFDLSIRVVSSIICGTYDPIGVAKKFYHDYLEHYSRLAFTESSEPYNM